ncbi:dTDP-4-dehydrorhamnose 3,5-epimerase family protein [Streptomyces sp. NRRL B-2790]|uniref:dTDP-4-dehydrorhamnose 3,5-epimerase family protein n=1 Tax=Streptomyces sp. NRRL B-2790 TaxID=1463835 RepID=UPI003569D7EF
MAVTSVTRSGVRGVSRLAAAADGASRHDGSDGVHLPSCARAKSPSSGPARTQFRGRQRRCTSCPARRCEVAPLGVPLDVPFRVSNPGQQRCIDSPERRPLIRESADRSRQTTGPGGRCPHHDDHGASHEWFRVRDFLAATGAPLQLAQVSCSVSRRGAPRGIHFTDVPPGQATYVTCLRGTVLDVVVDVRAGSPAHGRYQTVRLDESSASRQPARPHRLFGGVASFRDAGAVGSSAAGRPARRSSRRRPGSAERGSCLPAAVQALRSRDSRAGRPGRVPPRR